MIGKKRKPTRDMSGASFNKHERATAAAVGGQTVTGSGRSISHKGDAKTGAFLIECKSTKNASFSVTADLWNKILREATQEARLPAMSLKIEGIRDALIVIRQCDFVDGGTLKENERSVPKYDARPQVDDQQDETPAPKESRTTAMARSGTSPNIATTPLKGVPATAGKVHYGGDDRRCILASAGDETTSDAWKVTCALCRNRIRRR